MLTIYARLSDLQVIEEACPPGMESQLDVHIVSDLAWADSHADEGIVVACEYGDVELVKKILPTMVIHGMDEQHIKDLRRRFGC